MKKILSVALLLGVIAMVAFLYMRGLKKAVDQKSKAPTLNGPITDKPKSPKVDSKWAPSEEELKVIASTEAALHGKVVDEKGAPVANALVICLPNAEPFSSGQRRLEIHSDANGRFFIREANAPTLHIAVSAEGHYSTAESGGFLSFAKVPNSMPESNRKRMVGPSVTSPEAPRVFVLKKMGAREPLLNRSAGGVLVESQEFPIGTQDNQKLLVHFWFDPVSTGETETGIPIHRWGIEMSVPEGGGICRAEADATPEIPDSYNAPVSGYQPKIRIAFDGTDGGKNYSQNINASFFLKFPDGTYARMKGWFSFDMKRPYANVASWFNPSKGRSTEFDSSIELKAD